jgi:hypothetical protein
MANLEKLKIFHLLSQRPDSTGSGIYVQAMIREASPCGYDNYLVAGVHSDGCVGPDCIEPNKLWSPGPVMTTGCFILTQSPVLIQCNWCMPAS